MKKQTLNSPKFQLLANFVLFCFLLNQIIPVSFAAETVQPQYVQNAPTKTLEEMQSLVPETKVAQEETSQDFLNSSALTP